ncbi:putative ribosome biogenesis protein nep1, partial [Toxoplasma gondii CAST]
ETAKAAVTTLRGALRSQAAPCDDLRVFLTFNSSHAFRFFSTQAGRLCVFIRTADRQLIEISPLLTVPPTYQEFAKLMTNLLYARRLKAVEKNVTLAQIVKNEHANFLPPNSVKVALTVSGRSVALSEFVQRFKETDTPVVFVVGAVAHSDPSEVASKAKPSGKLLVPRLENASSLLTLAFHPVLSRCCGCSSLSPVALSSSLLLAVMFHLEQASSGGFALSLSASVPLWATQLASLTECSRPHANV